MQVVCIVADYTKGVVSTAKGPLTVPGALHLSRNGRYIAREFYSYSGPTRQFEIIDLTTQHKQDILVETFTQSMEAAGK